MQVTGLESSWNSQATADKLTMCFLEVYTSLQTAFPPDLQSQYNLTPRDLILWATGLQAYNVQGTDLLQVCVLADIAESGLLVCLMLGDGSTLFKTEGCNLAAALDTHCNCSLLLCKTRHLASDWHIRTTKKLHRMLRRC